MRAFEQSYAEALAEVAIEQGHPEQVRREFRSFLGLLQESAELRNFMASPAVPGDVKHEVIGRITARLQASVALRNFLFLIVDNRRSGALEQIEQAFVAELNARLGVVEAHVSSARELNEGERRELLQALERLTGKKVEARYRLEPELLGGAVVQIGSTIYDGSVRDRLDRLGARLASA